MCAQRIIQLTKKTVTTEKRHYRQTSSGHSRVFGCCSRECSHASSLRPHLNMLLCLSLCFVSSLQLFSMFLYIHFSPVCEFLVIVHTLKTGLLRCCLYRIQGIAQSVTFQNETRMVKFKKFCELDVVQNSILKIWRMEANPSSSVKNRVVQLTNWAPVMCTCWKIKKTVGQFCLKHVPEN